MYAQVWPSLPPGFVVLIFAVVGTLPARGAVACELLTLSSEIRRFTFDSTAELDQPLHQERRPQFQF